MKKIVFLLLLALLIPLSALAKPTGKEAKAVLDYYQSGNEPVLVDYKFCTEVGKEGETKNECLDTVDANNINKGDKVFVWMNYMVPLGTKHNVSVLFLRKNHPEKTRNISMTGSFRYRTWTSIPTNKAGTYSIKADLEVDDDYISLANMKYNILK